MSLLEGSVIGNLAIAFAVTSCFILVVALVRENLKLGKEVAYWYDCLYKMVEVHERLAKTLADTKTKLDERDRLLRETRRVLDTWVTVATSQPHGDETKALVSLWKKLEGWKS